MTGNLILSWTFQKLLFWMFHLKSFFEALNISTKFSHRKNSDHSHRRKGFSELLIDSIVLAPNNNFSNLISRQNCKEPSKEYKVWFYRQILAPLFGLPGIGLDTPARAWSKLRGTRLNLPWSQILLKCREQRRISVTELLSLSPTYFSNTLLACFPSLIWLLSSE